LLKLQENLTGTFQYSVFLISLLTNRQTNRQTDKRSRRQHPLNSTLPQATTHLYIPHHVYISDQFMRSSRKVISLLPLTGEAQQRNQKFILGAGSFPPFLPSLSPSLIPASKRPSNRAN